MNDNLDQPLVSICIPMYNAERTIKRTLTSIVNQTYKNIEVIIIDNCSSDNSVEIIREFKDSRIKLIRYKNHLSISESNWNRCFQYVNGKYMALYHSDDVYLPNMISRQVETFQKHPNIGGVFTQGNIINDNDDITGEFKLLSKIKSDTPYEFKQLFELILKYADFLPTPSAMFCTDVYLECSPFRFDQFKSASDFDMWLRIAFKYPIVILDEKLMNYRISKTQKHKFVNQLRTQESDFFKVMDSHLKLNKDFNKDSLKSYDMSRFGDQMICVKNLISIRDWRGLLNKIKDIRLMHFIFISILKPRLLYEKFKMLSYFKVFKV